MQPGIYYDMPFEEYAALPAWNASSLKRLYLSPRAAKYGLATPETPAMKTGTLIHMALLEPERFARECVLMPNFHGGMKDETAKEKGYDGGKQAKAAWMEEHKNATILENSDREEVLGIARSMEACRPAKEIIGASKREVSIVWIDPIDGLKCKARLDCLAATNAGGYIVGDVKRTSSVEPRAFRSQIGRLKMHIQATFYLRGLACITGRPYDVTALEQEDTFAWIAFESQAPNFCRVFQFDNNHRQAAHFELERLLRVVAWCTKEGSWPDLADQLVQVGPPDGYEPYVTPEELGEISDE